jgi:hypothetical protein
VLGSVAGFGYPDGLTLEWSSRLAVGMDASGLVFADLRDPTRPVVSAKMALSPRPWGVAIAGDYVYVSQGKDLFFDSLKLNADSLGNYSLRLDKDKGYEVSAQVKDLFFDSYKIRVEKEDSVTLVHRDLHVPVQFTLRVNFPTDKYDDPYKYVLDSAGVESNETWQEELDLLAHNLILSKDKLEKIILVGHTDDVADEQYNQKLGQNRVNFIINELVKRGVPSGLLEGRSAGEPEPLPKRKGEDLQMYRKRLRRVELLKELKKY